MTKQAYTFDLIHSQVGFHVRHLMISKVHGRFKVWGGTLEIDQDDITKSKLSVEIDAASIDTQETNRDAHLRSGDFFDTEAHPKLTFVATSIAVVDAENLKVSGDLTIRGTTRPVVLDVERLGEVTDSYFGARIGFSAKTSISRKEFGLTWNKALETGGIAVGDKVEITLEIEAIKAPAAAAA